MAGAAHFVKWCTEVEGEFQRAFGEKTFSHSKLVPFPPSAGCAFPSDNWMTESPGDLRWDFFLFFYMFGELYMLGARLTCFALLFHFGAVCKD